MDPVDKIAAAVMYEGYVLWPYRRSAPKNRQRWTFGAVYPRAFSEVAGTSDPWQMQTQCLVRGTAPAVRVRVRFLHVVERRVGRRHPDGTLVWVDELVSGRERYLSWDEALEREIALPELRLDGRSGPVSIDVRIPAGSAEEVIPAADSADLGAGAGASPGALVRSWEALEGSVEAGAERLREGLFRITVRIANRSRWEGQGRQETLRRTLVSTHTLLTAKGGEFISLTDPPAELRTVAAECDNRHTWPVLVGEPDQAGALLSSPIILPDYPQIAPESHGDLFDATEIDQLLLLNILTLSDAEKREVRASDPRAHEILERAESLTQEDFMRLHGAMRDFRTLCEADLPSGAREPGESAAGSWGELERTAPECVVVAGVEVRRGSRVRLRPRSGRDVMDIVLAGRAAIVEAVEQDYEERVHLAVVVEDDPGRDLGEARRMGHRFFFDPEEVEPLGPAVLP